MTKDEALPMIIAEAQVMIKDYDGKGIDEWSAVMENDKDGFEHWDDASFTELVYEIAFGDDAINRGFSEEDVLLMLREFSDKALAFDETGLNINDYCPN